PDMEENAKHIFDACEFLEALYQNDQLNENFGEVSHEFMYHAPCHLRVQGIGLPAMELLKLVPGVKVTDADAGCCGISGNYGYKAENYNLSMKIGNTLFDTVKASGVDTVLTDCGTCRAQIEHGAEVKTMHPISILAKAYHNTN
ncbi:Cysteine-rich domain-containing protein, partial [Propionispira arboris]